MRKRSLANGRQRRPNAPWRDSFSSRGSWRSRHSGNGVRRCASSPSALANSLDNFIARTDHSTDWLVWDNEVAAISAEYWKTIDTVVMGRKTYEVAVKMGTTSYPGAKNYVFSRTLEPKPGIDVEIVAEDPVSFIRRLKQQPGKGICVMGGGELAHALLEADLIDEIGLNMQPVLLGAGIPLFHGMSKQINLELLECRPLKSGSVYVRYRIRR